MGVLRLRWELLGTVLRCGCPLEARAARERRRNWEASELRRWATRTRGHLLCSPCSGSGGSQLSQPLPSPFCRWDRGGWTNPMEKWKRREQRGEGLVQHKRKTYDSSSHLSTLPSPRSAAGNAGRKPHQLSQLHPPQPTRSSRPGWGGHPSFKQARPRAPSPPSPTPARR